MPRKERLAGAERDRRDVDDQLVEEPDFGELPDEVSPTHEPHVLPARRLDHARVDGLDRVARELDRCVGDDAEVAMGEHPARDLVRPPPVARVLVGELVVEDPLVGRRPHRERADVGDERAVVERAIVILVTREEPPERVVRVGDEAVERGRRVVLGQAHRLASLPSHVPTTTDQNSG